MITTKLQTEIHTLSRQEKYHLIQWIVRDLEVEDVSSRNSPHTVSNHVSSQYSEKALAIDAFLKKWKGSLKGGAADTAKYQYLQEKYQ